MIVALAPVVDGEYADAADAFSLAKKQVAATMADTTAANGMLRLIT